MPGERIPHSEHPNCRCRKCRLVRFAEQVEGLLDHTTWNMGTQLTPEEHEGIFHAKVKELHQELVLR